MTRQPFVALVSLPEYWGEESHRYFLGPWCLFPDHPALWERWRDRILPVPWSDKAAFDRASVRAAGCVDRLMAFLSGYLNDVHSVRCSQRYWKILLWTWANNFVAETLDRSSALRSAYDALGSFDTLVVPLDDLGFLRETEPRLQKQAFELVRLSAILAFWGGGHRSLEFPERYRRTASEPEGVARATGGLDPGPQQVKLGEIVFGFLQYRRSETRALLKSISPEATGLDAPALDSGLPSGTSFSAALRSGLLAFPAADAFDELVRHLLPAYLPTFCLEDFPRVREAVLSRFTGKPRVILTGLGCQENLTFRLLSAESVEGGARLVCVQHGAMYGTYDRLPCRTFEREISDYYVGWGWTEENERACNLPSPPLSLYLQPRGTPSPSPPRDRIVLLVNEICPFLIDFRSSLKAWGSDRYFTWQQRFLRAVPEHLRCRITVRFKSERDYPIYRYLQGCFPTISIESKEVPFETRMDECRVAVCDCSSHVHAEAMMLQPVLLFWDPQIWRETGSAAQLTGVLADAGIHSDTPELAAERLSAIYDRADEWWSQEEVRRAKDLYLDSLFMPTPHWRERWRDRLGSICERVPGIQGEQ